MFVITIEAASGPELRAKILELAQALAGEPVTHGTAIEYPSLNTPVPELPEQLDLFTEPPPPNDTGEVPPIAEPAKAPELTPDQLRAKLRAALAPIVATGSMDKVKEILKPFGAVKVSEISDDNLAAAVAAAEAA